LIAVAKWCFIELRTGIATSALRLEIFPAAARQG